jgi:hypothetical protein
MSKPVLAAICNECNAELNEGQSAFYDDKREVHYCNQSCFVEWARDNVDMLAYEYKKENCGRVDL